MFLSEITLTVKENKTSKKVTLKQTVTDGGETLYPHDDESLINNEGVSKELEKKLLELF